MPKRSRPLGKGSYTIVLIKPHAVRQNWVSEIVDRYKELGLVIEAVHLFIFNKETAREFYREHEGKPFMKALVKATCEGVTMALMLSGENVIARVRTLNGATDPTKAEPGTIRHDFMGDGGPYNTVHGSSSPKAAKREARIVSRLKM